MKKSLTMIAALMLCSASLAMAADAPTAPKKSAAAKEVSKVDKLMSEPTEACHKMDMMGGGMGMMGNGAGNAMSPDPMKKMQEQMDKIRQTTDPIERQKLMQEHFQSMQEAMQFMRGNLGRMGGMDGCSQCCCQQHCDKAMGGKTKCKDGKCARGKRTGMKPQGGGMEATPQSGAAGSMEQRMDMMQMMMENMMEHQRQLQQSK